MEGDVGTDFEARRKEQEAARRAAAAERDAVRREALSAGARAPSRADGDSVEGVARVLAWGSAGFAALMVGVGLLSWGTPLAALALGGAVAGGSVAWAARRYGRKMGGARASASARLAGSLSAAAPWEQALDRATAAVQASDLEEARKGETLRSLRAAADEIRALQKLRLGSGSAELSVEADARVTAFIANCDEITSALASAAAPDAPSAVDALDALAGHLSAEAEARAELDEALRRASTLPQTQG